MGALCNHRRPPLHALPMSRASSHGWDVEHATNKICIAPRLAEFGAQNMGQNQEWLPHPCLPGGPQVGEMLRNPCTLGGPEQRGQNFWRLWCHPMYGP